jgi:dephospho-CoA kinase
MVRVEVSIADAVRRDVRVVGLTGGIGSGKSTVSRIFAKLGAEIIDADELARAVVSPGSPALEQIIERFGKDVLDSTGALDRPRMARVVFHDDQARMDLNRIVHPAVAHRAQEEIMRHIERGSKLVIYDVPLLYETGLEGMFDGVIVVKVAPEVQRARLRSRDQLSEEELNARIGAQLPLEEKVKRATYVINNDGTPEETELQVRSLWTKLAGDRKELN